MTKQKLSCEKLVKDLQKVAAQLGYTPSLRQLRTCGLSGPTTYYRYFGSWAKALQAAGLPMRAFGNLSRVYDYPSRIYLLTKEQRAYLAAAIDGEGGIRLDEHQNYAQITITQKGEKWLKDISKMVNGGTFSQKPGDIWNLYFRKKEVDDILRQILDYLHVKKIKALEALETLDLEPYRWVL